MKKIVSIALSLIMLMQLFPVSAADIEKKNATASQSFDSMATNYVPTEEVTLSGEGVAYVAETKAGENKALKMSLKSSAKTLSFKGTTISGMATYSFELMGDAGVETTVSLLAPSGSAASLFAVSADGKVQFTNGPGINTRLSPDRMQRFTVMADGTTKRASVYVNGIIKVANWYISSLPEQTMGIFVNAKESSGEKASLYIDSFAQCNGFNSRLIAPKEKYNAEVLDAISEPGDLVEQEEVTVGDAIFLNNNYDTEDSMSGMQLYSPKGGISERRYDDRRGNGYIYMKQGTEKSRMDYVLEDTPRYLVIEADLSIDTPGFSGTLFEFNNGEYSYILKLAKTGVVQIYSGSRSICTLKQNKWTTISVVGDFEKMTFDVYADKELIYSGISMQSSQTGHLKRLRVLAPAAGGGAIMVDNLRVYEGTALRDISAEIFEREEKSVVVDGTEGAACLGENKAIDLRSGAVYNGSEKSFVANAAYEADGKVWVSPDAVSALFGSEAGANSASYVVLEDVCKSFNKILYTDDRGFCIISDENLGYTSRQLWIIHDYLLYLRPEPEEILATFKENMSGVHPRVIITEKDIDRIKYNYNTKDYYKKWVDRIIKAADGYLTEDFYTFNEATNTFSSGARRGVRNRIVYLGIAYFMTGDLKYPQRAYKELQSAGNFKHWRNDIEYLDTAEMMVAFAIGYDWFYDVWTDTQRKWIADTVMEKGVKHSRAHYYGVGTGSSTWWTTADNNWNACCNHGTSAAAIALMDEYPELCSDLVSKAIRGIEPMLRKFYPSGAWYEGTSYYSYVIEHMSMWISSLNRSFGTDYNLMKAPSLDISGDYIIAIDGPVASNNFHDASEGHTMPASLSFLATTYDKLSYCGERLNAIEFYGMSPHFFDVLYWPTEFERGMKADLPKDMSFGTTELAVMRSEYSNPEATYLSYHAGKVVEEHSHVDTGTFVMDMSGVRWALDLGSEDYGVDGYFDMYGKRNEYYRARAEGHNCVVIDPDETPGQNLYAPSMPIKSLESGESSAYSTVDLTPAYDTWCQSYERGFMIAENRRTITIRDEFDFINSGHELYWFMHTRAEIEIADDNTAILSSKGKRLKAQLLTDIEGAKFSVMDAKPLPTSPNPSQSSNGTAIKLAVHAENVDGSKYIQIRFSDMDDELSNITPVNMPISTWTIDNTPYTTRPLVTDIKADGVTLDGFSERVTSYVCPVSYRTRHIPTITATAPEGCAVEITPADDVYDYTVIKVYRLDNPTNSRNYHIGYKLQITSEDKQYVPVSVKASSNPQVENPDINAADGNLSTRWSADGDGEWLQLEFDRSVPIKLIRVAAMNATTRQTKFDIEVSEDGNNWTKIIEHETDGVTSGYEYIECDAKGKYVRLLGHGNSVNTWNSILEFGVIDTSQW